MTRTFSKAYGLAGIRIGWGYCPKEIADVLNRVRAPFNVNIAAQKAAVAALADQALCRGRASAQRHMARVADRGDPQARQCRHPRRRQRRQFPAGAFRRREARARSRPLPDVARRDPARLRALTGCRNACGSPSAARTRTAPRSPRSRSSRRHEREQTDLQEDRADRRRPDRLLDRACRRAASVSPSMSRATCRAPRRARARRPRALPIRCMRISRPPSRTPISSSSARPSAPMRRSRR